MRDRQEIKKAKNAEIQNVSGFRVYSDWEYWYVGFGSVLKGRRKKKAGVVNVKRQEKDEEFLETCSSSWLFSVMKSSQLSIHQR